MKKIIWTYGLAAGFISTIGYIVMHLTGGMDFEKGMENGMIYGFASMIAAFSLIFVATLKYRKKNGGVLSFGKAFLIGLYISLIASTVYVGVWLFNYYNFYPDFADKYAAYQIEQMEKKGNPEEEIEAERKKMAEFAENYKNPLFAGIVTYVEILPLSLIISLISAAALRRKNNNPTLT